MKRSTALLSLVLLLCGIAAPAPRRTITATFNFDYTTVPACTMLHRTSCVTGFQFGLLVSNVCSNLQQIPNPTNHTGQVNGITLTAKVPVVQNPTFCVAARYFDAGGVLRLGPLDTATP